MFVELCLKERRGGSRRNAGVGGERTKAGRVETTETVGEEMITTSRSAVESEKEDKSREAEGERC